MKRILYIIGLAFAITSCNFLDTEVYGEMDEVNIYRNEKSCMAGLTGVYDCLGAEGVYGLNLWGNLDAGTDIMIYNREYGKSYIQLANNNYNNTDLSLRLTWLSLYEGINRANDYIHAITDRTAEECGGEQKQDMFIAEAKALRALYYMNLVVYWGEVPLRLDVIRDFSTQQKKKASQPELYSQIIQDLLDAEKGCLPANTLKSPGRIAKTTAQALLARAYMWQAGYPVAADTWGEALKWARKVKESGLHTLWKTTNGVNGYRALFINMCSNMYDLTYRESMFEVEFQGNGLDKTNESGKVGLYLGIVQGITTDVDVPFAYAWYDGSKMLFRMYEDKDARKWWNFADYSYKTVNDKAQKTMLTDAEKASKVDGNPGKWRAEYDPIRPWARNNSSINFPVMRYSDVLLMIAECANEVAGAPTQEAIDAINEVRTRAGVDEVKLSDFAGQEAFRDFVKEERTRELCFEVPRHMELRRWGKEYYMSRINLLKDQSLDPKNKKIGYDLTSVKAVPAINLAEKHLYYPIPQAELNTNPTCGQNANW